MLSIEIILEVSESFEDLISDFGSQSKLRRIVVKMVAYLTIAGHLNGIRREGRILGIVSRLLFVRRRLPAVNLDSS